MKKLLALLIITIILSSIPLVAAANSRPVISKVVFVYRDEDYAKPDGVGKPPKPDPDEPLLYELLGKNIKWKSLDLTYVINPSNNDDLGEDFVTGAILLAAETWDDASTTELFVTYTINYDAEINTVEPDFVNEIVFANIAEDRVIAVCIVWYIKGGPPNQRGIIEFDIMFDDYDYTWGNAGETDEEGLGDTSVMDLQNIATHELGHALGLADLYCDEATEQTMYGYGEAGEAKKRTLNTGDIEGIKKLYG